VRTGGDYFDAQDDAGLADLMRMVIADDGRWRAGKLAYSVNRLARYSWRSSAETLTAACARLVGSGGRAAA
jgi:hypothetical protein